MIGNQPLKCIGAIDFGLEWEKICNELNWI